MAKALNNGMDIIDSRDVIARIAELNDNVELDDDEKAELLALEEFAEEAGSATSEWSAGVTLIRDGYFEDFAQQYAEDLGCIQDSQTWPCSYINWSEAAESLQQDYSSAEFDGETYWFRS